MVDDSTDETADEAAGGSAVRRRGRIVPRAPWVVALTVVALALVAAGAGLRGLVDRPPDADSVDAGFAYDMSAHHSQAVQMAMVEFRGGADMTQRSVAQDIALTQQREIGIMSAWLTSWHLPQVSTEPPMRWMHDSGHDTHSAETGHDVAHSGSTGSAAAGIPPDSSRMPGMATDPELTQLSRAQGRDLDVLFLTLMIRHHRGGITMAQQAAARAQESDVRALARAMVINQAVEIDQMQTDLRALGAPPA
ncbi:DUF305 domain-containing protein [Protofrankia symbiont of Coriaria ruscifolia]|uniref:DUF305 domain-containing protein n=1 Tax=Candidatus Protofrankia californiensis TaxID=1839754 RepID=A0A1C3NUW0_9ACTN|nr:hypothetical protein FDG2_1062 [Candidatus Protofrankia californiensis]